MRRGSAGVPGRLAEWADAVLLPCFDGVLAPEWVRRRVGETLGGVCLFARNVVDIEQVAALSSALISERESVVIAIDEEAGDVTRLDAATGSRFPGAAALGRADNVAATRHIGRQVGQLLAGAGVSVNLAPCADVVLDPSNPVIGSRAFGSDPDLVSRHTAAWIDGQQSAGVAACVKHFPGHGDTGVDTHRQIAVLDGDLPRLRVEALPPFRAAIDAGTSSVMIGHLLVPAVDSVPATVSRRWITDILRGELGFSGTVVTDALEMGAVADTFGIAGAAVLSLAAGADLLCIGGSTRPEEEIDGIRDAIIAAVLAGDLDEERLADAAARATALGVAAMRAAQVPNSGRDSAATAEVSSSQVDVTDDVALRALDVAGPLPHFQQPIQVIRCDDTPNIAVGVVPWGPGTMVTSDRPEIVLHPGDAVDTSSLGDAGSVLVVTRDRHRHEWMNAVLADVRTARSDAVLVEMGISGISEQDAPALASYGATLANTRAVMVTLGGVPVTA